MLDRRYSAAEVAKLAGISLPTLTFFLREGILEPSVQRASGRGRGHVFDVTDLVAARTLNALRYPNTAAAHYKALVQFWHTDEGRELIKTVAARSHRKTSRVVLLVTDIAVEVDASPVAMMEKYKTSIVHCVDVAAYIDELNLGATEGLMRLDFQEPGSSGRVPPKNSRVRARKRSLKKEERARSTAELTKAKKTSRRSP